MGGISLNGQLCVGCAQCVVGCSRDALRLNPGLVVEIDEALCNGCSVCVYHCPVEAIQVRKRR
ncbi:MAG: 4Fe-4S binding protein [Actinobacteria bacterium]|nr:4Fe-4S binding protein [Actinomycetota bacterium]